MAKQAQWKNWPIFTLPKEEEMNLFEMEDNPSQLLLGLVGEEALCEAREAIHAYDAYQLTEDQLVMTLVTILKGGNKHV